MKQAEEKYTSYIGSEYNYMMGDEWKTNNNFTQTQEAIDKTDEEIVEEATLCDTVKINVAELAMKRVDEELRDYHRYVEGVIVKDIRDEEVHWCNDAEKSINTTCRSILGKILPAKYKSPITHKCSCTECHEKRDRESLEASTEFKEAKERTRQRVKREQINAGVSNTDCCHAGIMKVQKTPESLDWYQCFKCEREVTKTGAKFEI